MISVSSFAIGYANFPQNIIIINKRYIGCKELFACCIHFLSSFLRVQESSFMMVHRNCQTLLISLWSKTGGYKGERGKAMKYLHAQLCPTLSDSVKQLTRLLSTWGYSRQGYSSGLHDLVQGIFPTQESNPRLLCLQADSLLIKPSRKPMVLWNFTFALFIFVILPWTSFHQNMGRRTLQFQEFFFYFFITESGSDSACLSISYWQPMILKIRSSLHSKPDQAQKYSQS